MCSACRETSGSKPIHIPTWVISVLVLVLLVGGTSATLRSTRQEEQKFAQYRADHQCRIVETTVNYNGVHDFAYVCTK